MLHFIGILINFFLIIIIFLRVPQEDVGLTASPFKTNSMYSSNTFQKFVNIFILINILIYFSIAIKLNIINY